ncbi:DUF177 domain-containing protein [Roseibium sp. RKSG952]|uniref:DUF177 domain-containing protein n=1 Tax=Roseibium sp. RKSG952 TaxID=2529384 RepID=UPI0012BD36BC|nr:DUF177 domain-containing protein [Roseibium sp. RKSG952]MTH97770.1 DUF177 domain-containing protein [Roseibium sp. RKSG952]
MTDKDFPFSFKINAERQGDASKDYDVAPDAAALARIADAYNLGELKSLNARLTVSPWKKAGARVSGTIRAQLIRQCVVSLEDFEQTLLEEIDRTFEPVSVRSRRPRDLNSDGEIEIDLETLDPPDVMIDGVIDLGAVICEQLALCLDPFPRKPGVSFQISEQETQAEPDERPSPFAALAKLKPEGEA